jgi:hypothetical protein
MLVSAIMPTGRLMTETFLRKGIVGHGASSRMNAMNGDSEYHNRE